MRTTVSTCAATSNESNLDKYKEFVNDGKYVSKHYAWISVKIENLFGPESL